MKKIITIMFILNFFISCQFSTSKTVITANNIEVIYTIKPVDSYFPKELLGEKCIKSSSINNILDTHLILECDNLKIN